MADSKKATIIDLWLFTHIEVIDYSCIYPKLIVLPKVLCLYSENSITYIFRGNLTHREFY